MSARRILFIVDHYFPHIGGAEVVSQKVAEHMAQRGWWVTVLTSADPRRPQEAVINGVRVIGVARNRYLFTLLAIPKAFRLARDCDVIQTATYNAALVAWIVGRLRRRPVYLMVYELLNWLWFRTMNPFSAFLHWFFERFLIFLPFSHYIAISEFTQGQLIEKKIPQKKITMIYLGIDNSLFNSTSYNLQATTLRKELGYSSSDFLLLFFGRPGILKGVEDLLQAMKILNGTNVKLLMLLPDGGNVFPLSRIERGLGVSFLPSVPRSELPRYLSMADAVVVPSLQEGFGFSAVEACQAGCPVIASRVGALPETVSGKVIWTKPGDPRSLAKGIQKAVRGEWETIPPKHFSWPTALQKYDQLYSSIQLPTTDYRLRTIKRIAIIADPIDEQYAGIYTYTKNLIENLVKIDKENEYLFIHIRKNDFFKGKGKEVIIPLWRWLPGYATLRKFFIIPWVLSKHKIDVVHEPAHIAPFIFFPGKYKKIVTIHDLTPVLFPQYHIKNSSVIHSIVFPLLAKRADVIICDSGNTEKDFIKRYHPKCTTQTVHLAADKKVYRLLSSQEIGDFKNRNNLSSPFILYVGTIEPRKNISCLISAFERIKEQGLPHQLILIGKSGWKNEIEIELIRKSAWKNAIIWLEYVPSNDLHFYYNAADLFVFPSRYEGFGLPILEAMQCGCPVIAADNSSLPEVVGNAGVLVKTDDVDALADSIYNILSDSAYRKTLIQNGLHQAEKFSWEKTARKTIETYNKSLCQG
ncbi:glycosyltransferase [Candidatus Peregrinibacteria bacterium]|nr:glycosyltransferase [Candidatus Peregrinibacteria bacterium]